jgi:hypothetical protein
MRTGYGCQQQFVILNKNNRHSLPKLKLRDKRGDGISAVSNKRPGLGRVPSALSAF